MITLTLKDRELYNDSTSEFITIKGGTYHLEHSLVAISKWEQKYKLPFLHTEISGEKFLYYITCMCNEELNPSLITRDDMMKIAEYIQDPQSATTFSNSRDTGKRDILTSEVIYAIMTMAQVDLEWENRNFNRLMTILRVISIKNDSENKMSMNEIYKSNSELNEERKRKLGTKG